ncbi:hypothetical protein [Sphingopyxis macrogoltabida]|uniref:Uncharacterized protein n=1 Tax=Sphingopyxis macrogoltabida TaxID=33050 RepID=A0A0P0DMP1_SPHMC|nr:hypothetical protein [Sphingopyxis macrogoltabida]ALJ14143.1 hypothetical protein LH19_14830 [Sphingopyxis macrogoltabida]ALJ15376.1 hypothetical protein LH19_21090 [Sphingopyxis macrogoltabida]AMU90409.1 hypothetical protein ATM17_15405 [Sphingopyxis macrogoltabida]AMU91624.1 hypothetical protein ATM17_21665 [Sphingopyxis macrogoltabida]
MAREDFAYIADQLSGPQQRRLLALARAGKALAWAAGDDEIAAMFLIVRYTEPFGGAFADLTGKGMAVAQRVAQQR